jgi:hypothetical protein
MLFQQSARHIFLAPALGAAVAIALAACSSSGSGSGSGSGSTPSSSSAPSATASASPSATVSASASQSGQGSHPSSAQAAIEANWAAFFLSSTPIARRVALLQNGSAFESVIKAQANSPLASSATAKVGSVTVESSTQAKVIYTIFVSGSPALPNQPGVAVYQDGTWKVGDASFCGLLRLENTGSTAKLPAACSSAG